MSQHLNHHKGGNKKPRSWRGLVGDLQINSLAVTWICKMLNNNRQHRKNQRQKGTACDSLQLVGSQLLIEQLSVGVVSVESSHCFKGVILGWGVLPPSTPSRSQPFW